MRFFQTPNADRKEVNCILGAIQFDKVDKLSALINSETICYPNTADKMNLSKLPKDTNVCYNPDIDLLHIDNNSLDELAYDIKNKFETFIKSCDEK